MKNTLQFEVNAPGANNQVLAYDGTNEYKNYIDRLNGIANALNSFKIKCDEALSDINIIFDLRMVKGGFSAIQGSVGTAINNLPKYARMEAQNYYTNVLQELQQSFHIPQLSTPMNGVPDGLSFVIEQIEFSNGKFSVKEIDSTLFDRYLDAGLHDDLVAYVTVYNALHARLGNRVQSLEQLIIGNEGLQYNRKMDASKIGDLSKFL